MLLASVVKPRVSKKVALDKCVNFGGYEWEFYDLEDDIPFRLKVALNSQSYSVGLEPWHLDALTMLLSPQIDRSDAFKAAHLELVGMDKDKRNFLEPTDFPL
ncbi:hypothetical protein Poli38472_013725 [Pythium oligandrum]|uniref:Uncharacterized protein n=1 Tax=Pythium oligandrum TaxID=41045 RepID=A0A8K1FIZ5_PYTOL|nr:hypothetical protein Poli38472_013725 [Pythium oligandrum]|eukprot:TMW61262.1 hypothetical protein Poli38472_013725 [Pythium oligandrum]